MGLRGWTSSIRAALVVLAAGGCARSPPSTSKDDAHIGALASAFSKSAETAHVPRDLLVAIAKVEGGLAHPAQRRVEDIDIDNDVPAAGPLQLRRGKLDTLRLGAELVGKTELDLRVDADLALEAGALVLRELGAKTSATEDLA